ncbi:hypothetical protein E2542_SST16022 [Spatholobus suberectus]|nr:hypothetical protein E2542_SST16022 [Spatholobus suberectus]
MQSTRFWMQLKLLKNKLFLLYPMTRFQFSLESNQIRQYIGNDCCFIPLFPWFGENTGEAIEHVFATARHAVNTAWKVFKQWRTLTKVWEGNKDLEEQNISTNIWIVMKSNSQGGNREKEWESPREEEKGNGRKPKSSKGARIGTRGRKKMKQIKDDKTDITMKAKFMLDGNQTLQNS